MYAVIEGNSPGRVFVDRLDAPSCAFLFHKEAFCYVAGSPANDDFNLAMVSLIFDDLLSCPENQELVLFVFSDAWREKLDGLLGNRGAIRIVRKMFAFDPDRFQAHAGWRERIPEGACIRLIDESLAEQHTIYRPLLKSGAKRFGVCLMRDDEIISACKAVCVGGGKVEIDIWTEEKHRGQGYAFLTACAFIEESLSRNLTPNWACWPEREVSYALAKKLGFEDRPDVPAYYWAPGL